MLTKEVWHCGAGQCDLDKQFTNTVKTYFHNWYGTCSPERNKFIFEVLVTETQVCGSSPEVVPVYTTSKFSYNPCSIKVSFCEVWILSKLKNLCCDATRNKVYANIMSTTEQMKCRSKQQVDARHTVDGFPKLAIWTNRPNQLKHNYRENDTEAIRREVWRNLLMLLLSSKPWMFACRGLFCRKPFDPWWLKSYTTIITTKCNM